MAGTPADAAACSLVDQCMALCTPAPTLPHSTYTVVGFMGTGRVTFNAALAAVFIEVRGASEPPAERVPRRPESPRAMRVCVQKAPVLRQNFGEGRSAPASCVRAFLSPCLPRPAHKRPLIPPMLACRVSCEWMPGAWGGLERRHGSVLNANAWLLHSLH